MPAPWTRIFLNSELLKDKNSIRRFFQQNLLKGLITRDLDRIFRIVVILSAVLLATHSALAHPRFLSHRIFLCAVATIAAARTRHAIRVKDGFTGGLAISGVVASGIVFHRLEAVLVLCADLVSASRGGLYFRFLRSLIGRIIG
jgi:hypothetical protein